MTKRILFATAFAVAAVSCTKKEDTGTITTQETTTSHPETTTSTTVTPVDSATAVISTSKSTTTAEQTTTTKTTTGEVFNYVSDDAKTKFSAIYDADKGTAAVKNETTGQTYDMKSAVSGSGSKYADKDGYFFWTHQGEFTFGKGDKDLIHGKKVK